MNSEPKFTLHRVRLNASGYDRSGCYWGLERPLYWATNDHDYDHYFRAADRDAAKRHIRKTHPSARFFR